MKYIKRSNNIDSDFMYYMCKECLFDIAFFGHKGNKRKKNKINYIWKVLLKQYGKEIKS